MDNKCIVYKNIKNNVCVLSSFWQLYKASKSQPTEFVPATWSLSIILKKEKRKICSQKRTITINISTTTL